MFFFFFQQSAIVSCILLFFLSHSVVCRCYLLFFAYVWQRFSFRYCPCRPFLQIRLLNSKYGYLTVQREPDCNNASCTPPRCSGRVCRAREKPGFECASNSCTTTYANFQMFEKDTRKRVRAVSVKRASCTIRA